MRQIIPFISLLLLSSCAPYQSSDDSSPLTYLALGDSYTIGESVEIDERWPVQLADSLAKTGIKVEDPKIIARTGWTTNELMQAIEDSNVTTTFDMVSLLIGVNNQYRGYEISQYINEFEALLNTSIHFANDDTSHVFVLSIPDYGVTPFGQTRNPDKIAIELDRYNAIADSISGLYGIPFIEITKASRDAIDDPELVASDQLHPSGKMYRQWVDASYETVKAIFND